MQSKTSPWTGRKNVSLVLGIASKPALASSREGPARKTGEPPLSTALDPETPNKVV